MATKTFPHAVIYHGVFYPANTPIEEVESTDTPTVETDTPTESTDTPTVEKEEKPKGKRK